MITRAQAFLRDAAEFFISANAVDDRIGEDKGFEILSPKAAYYNMCHSIELAAKAVLVHAGYTEGQLRGVGHDLQRAAKEAIEAGLVVTFSPDEERLLGLLNSAYRRLRYPEGGELELPIWGPLTEMAIKLIKSAIVAVPGGSDVIRPLAMDRMTGFACWHY